MTAAWERVVARLVRLEQRRLEADAEKASRSQRWNTVDKSLRESQELSDLLEEARGA